MHIEKLEGDYLVLSTGKRIRTHGRVIGLELGKLPPEDRTGLDRIKVGYQATVWSEREALAQLEPIKDEHLTDAECREIGELMVMAWSAFLDGIPPRS